MDARRMPDDESGGHFLEGELMRYEIHQLSNGRCVVRRRPSRRHDWAYACVYGVCGSGDNRYWSIHHFAPLALQGSEEACSRIWPTSQFKDQGEAERSLADWLERLGQVPTVGRLVSSVEVE